MMKVGVKLFAILREKAGSDELLVDLPEGASVGTLLKQLKADHPTLARYFGTCMVSVNMNYETEGALIQEGDEVALIPPVSGG